MNPPCKKCTDRQQGCHAKCEAYKKFWAFCKKQEAQRRKEALINRYNSDQATKAIRLKRDQNK